MVRLLEKIDQFLPILALILLLYHLVYVFYILQGATYHYITHFGACLIFLLLSNAASRRNSKKKRIICLILIAMTFVPSTYIYINAYDLAMNFGFISNTSIFMGILLVLATVFTAWLIWGPILPIITLIFVAYFFLGHHLPQPFYHRQYSIGYVVSYLCAGTNSGIFGYLLPVSANFLFLLLSMGGIFIAVRLLPAFLEGGKALGNLAKTGPAYGAVVASSLFGMVSGAAAGNAAFTGTFTIPTMKSRGFSGADAGGIEATASNGGQLMPPIMAATAFIMAAFIGRPYIDIALRAVIPAVIYYIGVAFSVYLLVRSKRISPPREPVDYHILIHRMPLFVIVLSLLIYLLMQRYSVGFAAAISIISLIALSLLQKETRPSVSEGLDGCRQGVEIAASIAVLFGLIGLMAQSIITPNLGVKIASFITGLTEGSLLLSLVFCMILCIVLGAGMPTAPAYVLASLTAIPAMMTLGVPKLQAHFFVFYFATISALTPPVSTASLITSRIADAGWMKTSWSAMKIAIVGWLLPFVFVMAPSILEFPNVTQQGMIVTSVMILATLILGITMYGYAPSIGHLRWFERFIFFISFVFLACYIVVSQSIIYIIMGATVFLVIFVSKKVLLNRQIDLNIQ